MERSRHDHQEAKRALLLAYQLMWIICSMTWIVWVAFGNAAHLEVLLQLLHVTVHEQFHHVGALKKPEESSVKGRKTVVRF